ncbi:hypothetical protein [Sporomusa malonica]|uniref:Uncharacterized protein n=1 Tax=Sporomusa malonica TaxID=112901 RepID=A0A1W2F2C0_9FIRM|nr:hypothetical protein [Sporomusa malonica]SMD16103.1 hypothetical protein SAMN04488500_1403 [Sporomusa malonica]
MEFAYYVARGVNEKVSAIEVDSNPNDFIDRTKFRCMFCGIQLEFSHGTSYPLFKRWRGTAHMPHCIYGNITNQIKNSDNNKDIELLVSTILPRALMSPQQHISTGHQGSNVSKQFTGKRTRMFISSVKNLLDPKKGYYFSQNYESMQILAETGEKYYLKDLFGAQDEIIDKIDRSADKAIVCIVKGNTLTPKATIGDHVLIPLSTSGKHKNSQKFSLFIPKDYVPKNSGRLDDITGAFIVGYGIARKTDYGYQMTIFSIHHQVAVLKKYEKSNTGPAPVT